MHDERPMIPVARPTLGEEETAAVRAVLLSGWVAQGPEVAAFEREFADFTGAPHACAVSSGTAALHLALHAVGVEPGDEVITVSHTFIATANAISYCGARPVFVDIDPATFNMDPALIEKAITPRTRVILPLHQIGLPCDMAAILEVAARHRSPSSRMPPAPWAANCTLAGAGTGWGVRTDTSHASPFIPASWSPPGKAEC